MNKFIEVTSYNGDLLLINIDHIKAVIPNEQEGSKASISLDGEMNLSVKEDYFEIKDKIEKALAVG